MCAVQWVEFDQYCGCLGDWLAQAEERIMHEAYGSTLDKVASFGAALEVRIEGGGWWKKMVPISSPSISKLHFQCNIVLHLTPYPALRWKEN